LDNIFPLVWTDVDQLDTLVVYTQPLYIVQVCRLDSNRLMTYEDVHPACMLTSNTFQYYKGPMLSSGVPALTPL